MKAAEAVKPRAVFITWASLRRADTIAGRLGISSVSIQYLYRGTPLPLTICKYLLQAGHTFILLARRRPRVVFVTNPPIFAVLVVYLYCLLSRARFVVDSHSGCFVEAHWRRWDRLQKFLAQRAALNLVHNNDNARLAEGWGVRFLVFPSLPPALDVEPSSPPRDRALAVYICSFKDDEPVDSLLEAACGISHVDFVVTGRAPDSVRSRLPANVRLTGFLGDEEYNRLLAGADLIVALTTRSGTLLYGAQEAIALGKPLVLSRTPTLEAYFTGGAVFAENTPEALRTGILAALERRTELAADMQAFARRYREEGEARLRELKARVGLG